LKTTPLCEEVARSSIFGVKPFKIKKTKKWKIEKYRKNPLMYPLKITLLRRKGPELRDGSTETKKKKLPIISFQFLVLN
jgi:hypothetical protein